MGRTIPLHDDKGGSHDTFLYNELYVSISSHYSSSMLIL